MVIGLPVVIRMAQSGMYILKRNTTQEYCKIPEWFNILDQWNLERRIT
jgi:hypothetical protein